MLVEYGVCVVTVSLVFNVSCFATITSHISAH